MNPPACASHRFARHCRHARNWTGRPVFNLCMHKEDIMATTTRSRSEGTPKRAPRAKSSASSPAVLRRAAAAREDATAAVRKISRRTSTAVRSVPVNRKTVSIAIAALTAAGAAGVALFFGRDRLAQAAVASRDKLRQAADDLSTVAHEQIDKARSNITRLRTSKTGMETQDDQMKVAI